MGSSTARSRNACFRLRGSLAHLTPVLRKERAFVDVPYMSRLLVKSVTSIHCRIWWRIHCFTLAKFTHAALINNECFETYSVVIQHTRQGWDS